MSGYEKSPDYGGGGGGGPWVVVFAVALMIAISAGLIWVTLPR